MAGELFALLLQAISNDDDRAAVGAALGALAAALRAAGALHCIWIPARCC